MCWRGFRGSGESRFLPSQSRRRGLITPLSFGAPWRCGGGAHDPVGCAYKAASHLCQPVRVGGQGQRYGGAVPCGRCPEAFNQHIVELKGEGLTGVEDVGVLKLLKIRVCINLSELCLPSSGPSVTPACRVWSRYCWVRGGGWPSGTWSGTSTNSTSTPTTSRCLEYVFQRRSFPTISPRSWRQLVRTACPSHPALPSLAARASDAGPMLGQGCLCHEIIHRPRARCAQRLPHRRLRHRGPHQGSVPA